MQMIAKYTEVLKNLLDTPQTKELIDNAMSTYPLYESTSEHEFNHPNIVPTREELNKKILNYYKYREIGFETVGRFIDELEIALVEIMPYYNQLYFSADQDYNLIYNVDYVRTINRDKDETNNSTANGTSSSTANDSNTTQATVQNYNKHVQSDTPQSELSITNQQIDQVNYANQVDWNHTTNTDSGTSSGTSSSSGTNRTTATVEGEEQEQTVETTKGNYGVVSAQDLIAKYRDIIINIDQQIINDPRIAELFMLVY
jgi:hypothetical protein